MLALAKRMVGGVARPFRLRWPEWALVGTLLAQACQLLSAHDLSANRIYRILASMVHESTLGRVALVVALLWLLALVLNGTFVAFRRISPWARAALALFASGYWGVWSVTLWQATGPVNSVSYINHAALAVMAAICTLMSAREVAFADERAACRSRRTTG